MLAQTKVTQDETQSTFRLLRLALPNAASATSRMNTKHPYYQVDVCFKISEFHWVLANSSLIPSLHSLHFSLFLHIGLYKRSFWFDRRGRARLPVSWSIRVAVDHWQRPGQSHANKGGIL